MKTTKRAARLRREHHKLANVDGFKRFEWDDANDVAPPPRRVRPAAGILLAMVGAGCVTGVCFMSGYGVLFWVLFAGSVLLPFGLLLIFGGRPGKSEGPDDWTFVQDATCVGGEFGQVAYIGPPNKHGVYPVRLI